MENRKKLHDAGLAVIFIGILNLFMFSATFIAGTIDGSAAEAIATVGADAAGAVKVMLGLIAALIVLLVSADVLLGMKALKISQTPKTDKGYITVAMFFLVMSAISTILQISSLINGNAPVVEVVLNLVSSALNVCIYVMFIKAANAVRREVLIGKK